MNLEDKKTEDPRMTIPDGNYELRDIPYDQGVADDPGPQGDRDPYADREEVHAGLIKAVRNAGEATIFAVVDNSNDPEKGSVTIVGSTIDIATSLANAMNNTDINRIIRTAVALTDIEERVSPINPLAGMFG